MRILCLSEGVRVKATVIPAVLLLILASCSRSAQTTAPLPRAGQPPEGQTPAASAQPEEAPGPAAPLPADRVTYQPDQDRVLRESDGPSAGMEWKALGMAFPDQLADVHYGLLFSDAPLMDPSGNRLGHTLPAGSRVTVKDAGPWVDTGTAFRRLFEVRWEPGGLEGWVDASTLVLVTGEAGSLAAGVVQRKIVAGGGDTEYNLLAIVDAGRVTLIDTSSFPFANEFHPSGVLRAAIMDVNGNGSQEVVIQAETIVSLSYLGASPLRWVAWLRPRDGGWKPILRYSESYGTDAGYSYTTTMRAFDSTGASGMLNMVRLDTEYVLVSGESVFRAPTVTFYTWSGTTYQKAPLDDLPRHGAVTADQVPLLKAPGSAEAAVGVLARGEVVFVFDRSDTRQAAQDASSWWYKVVTKSGDLGWISGASVDLSWIDPLVENLPVFLGKTGPR